MHTTLDPQGRIGPIGWCEGPEVWHGVHWLLRDPHWRTPPVRFGRPIGALENGAHDPDWQIELRGVFEPYGCAGAPTAPGRVRTRLRVTGTGSGVLTVSGEVKLDSNVAPLPVHRIGLCLLHPLTQAGAKVEIVHDDGRTTRSSLPRLISPWPPFSGIRVLRIALQRGVWAVAEFDGESFELEDQRNNADASYKTYARSNFLPRPFLIEAGAAIRQQLRLWVDGRPARRAPGRAPGLDLSQLQVGPAQAFELGLAVEPADLRAPARTAARAARLAPAVLHLTCDPRQPLAAGRLEVLSRMRAAAGARLRLDLLEMGSPAAQAALPGLAQRLHAAGATPFAVAVFPTSAEAVRAARAAFPRARVGGGTPDFFVQLNRMDRLPALDFLAFRVCPTVHQADDRTVMDSAMAVPGMLQTLALRRPGLPVVIGPSGMAARRSPLGALAPDGAPGPVPLAATDPRERSAMATAWAVGQVAASLAAGAQGATVLRWADLAATGPSTSASPACRWPGAHPGPAGGWAEAPAGRAPDDSPSKAELDGGVACWHSLRSAHPDVRGWRWPIAGGTQDWLVHLGGQPLVLSGWGAATRVLWLDPDGVWRRVGEGERDRRQRLWAWPAHTVLVVERGVAPAPASAAQPVPR